LDGSFLAQPQADVLGQQGHDDLAEEPDGVLVELGLEGVVEFGDVLVLAHHGVEGEEGAGAASDRAFWTMGWRRTARQPASRCRVAFGLGCNGRIHAITIGEL
jgi:hypothetical protein